MYLLKKKFQELKSNLANIDFDRCISNDGIDDHGAFALARLHCVRVQGKMLGDVAYCKNGALLVGREKLRSKSNLI